MKPLEAFNRNAKARYGRHSICKVCHGQYLVKRKATDPSVRERISAQARARYATDPERHRAHAQKYRDTHREAVRALAFKGNLKYWFRMTIDEYQSLLEKQGGVCAICGGGPNGKGRFHVDHDHTTGKVRGLLCHSCNAGIGNLRDSPEVVRRALAYLERAADILATADVRAEQENGNH